MQIALLLDTSGSMDGLIDQARTQLWKIVNELALAKRNGVSLYLEKDFLVTDLFSEETTRNRQVLLIYMENTLKDYLLLIV